MIVGKIDITETLKSVAASVSQWVTSGSDLYRSSGKVGIGTTSPSAFLEVGSASGTDVPIRISNTYSQGIGNSAGIDLALKRDIGGVTIGSQIRTVAETGNSWPRQSLTFSTGNQCGGSWCLYERMRINSNGSVGIGTTSPASRLSVNGGASFGTYSENAAPSNGIIVSGNVGIGTVSPAVKLHVVGQIASALPSTMIPDGVSETIDFSTGNVQVLSLALATGNVNIDFINAVAGGAYAIKIVQGEVSSSVSWPPSVKWPNGIPLILSTEKDAIDIVSLFYDGSSFYAAGGNNYR